MAKIGNTKIQKIGDSNYILVPAKVLKDKSFPLKENSEDLIIKIFGKRLVVEAYGKN